MRMRDVEHRGEPPVGPFDPAVEPALDRTRFDLADDRRLVRAGIGADVQCLARRHEEDFAQPLEAVGSPAIEIAAARIFGPRRQAQVEPIAVGATEHAVGRLVEREAHDLRGRPGGGQHRLDGRIRKAFSRHGLASFRCSTVAVWQDNGRLSIVSRIAGVPAVEEIGPNDLPEPAGDIMERAACPRLCSIAPARWRW